MHRMTQEQLNEQLFEAVKDNDIETAKNAIADGADINAIDKHGSTPLHWAALEGHTEMVKMLIDAEAKVNTKNEFSRTPLHYAAQWYHTELGNMLIDHGGRL